MSDSVADNPAKRPFAVRLTGVTKTFGGVTALSDVSLDVYVGEIHALLGENGAGKSTILKILNGVHAPTAGRIEVYGEPLEEHTPEAAKRAGIGMIFQEMSLVPTLSAAQNIFLNNEAKDGLGLIDDKAAARRARELFETLGVEIDPKALVGDLSAGQRQLTEIVKAISRNVRVLILDEPTTALSGGEVEKLFAFLRRLKSEGVAIIYVSHRMDEITRIADRATILRDGRHVVTAPMSELTLDRIIEYIVGRRSRGFSDVKRPRRLARRAAPRSPFSERSAQAYFRRSHALCGRSRRRRGPARQRPQRAGARPVWHRPQARGRHPHPRGRRSRSQAPETRSPKALRWCRKTGCAKGSFSSIRSSRIHPCPSSTAWRRGCSCRRPRRPKRPTVRSRDCASRRLRATRRCARSPAATSRRW